MRKIDTTNSKSLPGRGGFCNFANVGAENQLKDRQASLKL